MLLPSLQTRRSATRIAESLSNIRRNRFKIVPVLCAKAKTKKILQKSSLHKRVALSPRLKYKQGRITSLSDSLRVVQVFGMLLCPLSLMIEGYLNADGEFQSIGRLRECFVRALDDLHPEKFIESYRPKTLKLSVHPDLVTWNQEKLLGHDDVRVCDLVGKLAAVGQLHIQ